MKKILLFIIVNIFFISPTYSTTFTGGVTKVGQQDSNQVVDSNTKNGISFAKISIPQKNFKTYTDANGNFELPRIELKQPMILNVEKEGYRPFSLTINSVSSLQPLKIEIAQSEAFDIVIENEILHLGDDSFSRNSANANDFKIKSSGPYYSKDFIMTQNAKNSTNYLIIGSVVGLDTKLAKSMGQNRIKTPAYSTPAEIFFNGSKIGELNINGDNQRVKIPRGLIIADKPNQVTIKTGQNTLKQDHVDYDDIEIMNLSILSE